MLLEGRSRASGASAVHMHPLTRLADHSTAGPADAVTFQSGGVTLVIGDDGTLAPHAIELAESLQVIVCAPGIQDVAGLPGRVVAVGGRIVAIGGHLGAFTAQAASGAQAVADFGQFSPKTDRTFDLVLDLSRAPRILHAVPPLGYFAPGADAGRIARAIRTMLGLVGCFSKPRYFEYEAGLCAHGAQGLPGCDRCIDVCSAGAIRSAGEVVEVDPFLCQGCATCTLACPTGALSFRKPASRDLASEVDLVLSRYRDEGLAPPVIVVHTPASTAEIRAHLPEKARAIEVAALPAFGEELWVRTLARGAAGIVLVSDATVPVQARALLDERVTLVRALLSGVGIEAQRIACAPTGSVYEAVEAISRLAAPVAKPWAEPIRGKRRQQLMTALDTVARVRSPTAIDLDARAPFGKVTVDRAKCTLCHGCSNVCPTAALVANNAPVPSLSFIAENCINCGLCEIGCPEAAISLSPRFITHSRNEPHMLHEDSLACCTSCGQPFMGRRLLKSSIARVKDFPGLIEMGGVERLHMCPACRQRATVDPV